MKLTAKEKKLLPLLKKNMSDDKIAKKLKMKATKVRDIKMSMVDKILTGKQDEAKD